MPERTDKRRGTTQTPSNDETAGRAEVWSRDSAATPSEQPTTCSSSVQAGDVRILFRRGAGVIPVHPLVFEVRPSEYRRRRKMLELNRRSRGPLGDGETGGSASATPAL